jgi:hypothetical protein
MSTKTILQLPAAIGLTGNEWLEIATPSVSQRATSAQLVLLGKNIAPVGPTGVAVDTPSGNENNYTVNGTFGPLIGFVDLTPSGLCTITGISAGFDGQIIIITNLSAFLLTLAALSGASLAVNQFRLATNLDLTQYNSQAFKYSATIGKWVKL